MEPRLANGRPDDAATGEMHLPTDPGGPGLAVCITPGNAGAGLASSCCLAGRLTSPLAA